MGVREALSWLKDQRLYNAVVEMDSQLMYYAIKGPSVPSSFDLIVDDIKESSKDFICLDFCFVKRSANEAARVVARVASSLSGCMEWLGTPPLFLLDVLHSDSR